MSVFRGVPRLKKGHTRSHIPRVFKTKRSLKPRVHDAHVGPAASQSAHSWPGMYVFSKKKLVGGCNPFEKYDRQNGFIFPNTGVKIPNIFETTR